MMTNKKLIYLAGPTGVGKTDISITLAEKLNTVGSLISLKRTRVGSFSINESIKMESLESKWKSLGS